MKTFSSLREKLSRPDAEILCPSIHLVPHRSIDGAPAISGPGRFTFLADGNIQFELQASLTKIQSADLYRNHLRYAWSLAGLHLHAVGYNGMAYQGWIERAKLAQDSLTNMADVRIVGSLSMLQTETVALKGPSSATVVYFNPPQVPLSTWRRTISTHDDQQDWMKDEIVGHSFTTSGTKVTVLLNKDSNELEISGTEGTGGYSHPYLEDFLSEPFRALNGSNSYPRYVLRNRGDGTARLRIFPHVDWKASLGGARATFELIEPEGYWGYFSKYLEHLAGQGSDGPLIGPSYLTLFHDEVNRAVRGGSHWIVSLALSSAIEGLLKRHPAWSVEASSVSDEQRIAAESLLSTLESAFLRRKLFSALEAACRDQHPNGSSVLKSLVDSVVIENKHKKAWEKFRHYVAHGNLLDHSTRDERLDHFVELYELFQILTAVCIGFSTADYPLSASGKQLLESYKSAKHA